MIEIPRHFPGKHEGDKIVLYVRKHWIKYVLVSLLSAVLFLIPVVALVAYLINQPVTDSHTAEIVTISIGIFLLIVMGLILQSFVDFYLDLFVVLEDRIVFVRQNGFFNQQIDEANIWDIDEVGVDIKGILKSSLGYGDLIVHTGNDEAILTVDGIPDPAQVGREIMRLHKEHAKPGESKSEIDEIKETVIE